MLSQLARNLRLYFLGQNKYCIFKRYKLPASRPSQTTRRALRLSHSRDTTRRRKQCSSASGRKRLPFLLSNSHGHLTHNRSCMIEHFCDAIKLESFAETVRADIEAKQEEFAAREHNLLFLSLQLQACQATTLPILVDEQPNFRNAIATGQTRQTHTSADEADLKDLASNVQRLKSAAISQAYDGIEAFFTEPMSEDGEKDDFDSFRNYGVELEVRGSALLFQRLQQEHAELQDAMKKYLQEKPSDHDAKVGHVPSFTPDQMKSEIHKLQISRQNYENSTKRLFNQEIIPYLLDEEKTPIYKLSTSNLANVPATVPQPIYNSDNESSTMTLMSDRDREGRPVEEWYIPKGTFSELPQPASKLHEIKIALTRQESELRDLRSTQASGLALHMASCRGGRKEEFDAYWRETRGFDFEERDEDLRFRIEDIRGEYLQERSKLREEIDAKQIRSDLEFEDRTSDGFDGFSADHEMRRAAEAYTPFASIRKWQRGVAREVEGFDVPPSECEDEVDLDEVNFEERISNGNGSDYDKESRARKQRWIPKRASMERSSEGG